jgi:hypothetical protein
MERVLDQFPKYHKDILFGDFDTKLGREETFKLLVANKSLDEICSYNGFRAIKFVVSITLSSVQSPHIAKFINTRGLLLTEGHIIRFITS